MLELFLTNTELAFATMSAIKNIQKIILVSNNALLKKQMKANRVDMLWSLLFVCSIMLAVIWILRISENFLLWLTSVGVYFPSCCLCRFTEDAEHSYSIPFCRSCCVDLSLQSVSPAVCCLTFIIVVSSFIPSVKEVTYWDVCFSGCLLRVLQYM